MRLVDISFVFKRKIELVGDKLLNLQEDIIEKFLPPYPSGEIDD